MNSLFEKCCARLDKADLGNLSGLLLLIVSIFVFGLRETPTEMGIAVAASFVYLAFVNLHKFESFKGAGFEGQLRKVVDEANATIAQLKAVAVPLVITGISNLKTDSVLAIGDVDDQISRFKEIVQLQLDLGLDSTRIDEGKVGFYNLTSWVCFEKMMESLIPDSRERSDMYIEYSSEIGHMSDLEPVNIDAAKNFFESRFNDPASKQTIAKAVETAEWLVSQKKALNESNI